MENMIHADKHEFMGTSADCPGRECSRYGAARGYPNFVGVAEYAQTVSLGKVGGGVILDMGRQNHLFEVAINGRSAGVLGWPPYRLEVGALLRQGANRFVFRMHTALGGILSRYYKSIEKNNPPVGLLETPVLYSVEENDGCDK